MSINKAIISGNLTRDAELRQAGNGMEIASFSVAVNDRRKDASGEWKDYPNYIDCTMFGTRAGKLAAYLTKGTKVCAEGKLRWSQWEKDGQKRSKVEVVVEEIELMNRKEQSQGTYMEERGQAYKIAPQMPMYDDDIPF